MEFDRIYLGFNDEYTDHCDYIDYSEITTDSNQKNKGTFTIMQLNSRGVLNKRDALQLLLNDIKKDSRVDVVLLVETWLNKSNSKRFMVPGYKFFSSHRRNKKGGGVGVLVNQKFDCRPRPDLSMNIPNLEALTVEIKTHSDSILACSIYRPPNSKVKDFIKNYKRLLDKFSMNQKERLLIGLDHNLDLMKHESHKPTKEFIDLNLDLNLIPTITKPTRITKTSATLLDNIIVGKQFHNFVANIAISDISDHLPVVLTSYQPTLYKKQALNITTRTINDEACNSIVDAFQNWNWTNDLADMSADDSYKCFHNRTQEILDKFCPVKQIKIRPNKILKDPWMVPGLLKCTQRQKLLYKKHLADPTDQSKFIKYKTYRNKLQQILRRNKEDYYKQKCKDYKRNLSKLWKVINKITHKMNDKSSAVEYLKINNIDYYETKTISEEFATHFATVGKRYASAIKTPHHNFYHYLKQIPHNTGSMYMTPTSKEELEKLIDQLPNKTSKGHDDISNVLLKRIKHAISNPLVMIFNKSLQEGTFPEEMKKADVIPLFKNKERYLVTNYRPISLLVTISKLLEKVVYTRTYKFLCYTNQLYQSQYGFRSGFSCENAICELVGRITKHKEKKESSIGVFIDLSKAFDTLNHSMLLKKMEKYGIRGLTLDWYTSYLTNRQMRVKCPSDINGKTTYSSYHKLDYGTPQGSCLGPLLFLIYINDLYQSIEYCNMILFADDTTLIHGNKSLIYLKWMIEEDLSNMTDWFNANQLTVNLSKTECILFPVQTMQTKDKVIQLVINDKEIQSTKCTKFLGTWIDQQLQWKTHTSNLLMRLKQNTNLLKVGNKFLTKSSKKIYYYAHIYSHIIYGLIVWGNMIDPSTIKKVQKCMDICFNLITHQTPTIANYKKEKMLKLDELIKLENLKMGYKLEHSLLPSTIQTMLKSDSKEKTLVKSHSYCTRTKNIPNLPIALNKSYHASFLVQSIKEYEKLPLEMRMLKKLSTFICKVKANMLCN